MKDDYTQNKKDADQTETDINLGGEGADESVIVEETLRESVVKLRDALKKCEVLKQDYLTGWQRAKAEFINARKRDTEANAAFVKFANEGLIVELLSVLESFEHAFANKEAWEKVDKNWRMGVEYIATQLKTVLENAGLKEINPLGEKYDLKRDEVVSHELVDDEKQDQSIIAVIQRGYELYGKLLKSPKVKVAEYKAIEEGV